MTEPDYAATRRVLAALGKSWSSLAGEPDDPADRDTDELRETHGYR